MLCRGCEKLRFPSKDSDPNKDTQPPDLSSQVEKDESVKDSDVQRDVYSKVVIDPVLTYVRYSINNSPVDLICAACREFYTVEELSAAKEKLWLAGDPSVLPQYVRRRDSSARSEIDATITDIVMAIQKLDSAAKIPVFAVSCEELSRIPKASPAEKCEISMCERIASLEARLERHEEQIKKLESHEALPVSYARAVTEPRLAVSQSVQQATLPVPVGASTAQIQHQPGNAVQVTSGHPGPKPQQTTFAYQGLHVKLPPVSSKVVSSHSEAECPKVVSDLQLNANKPALGGSLTSLASNISKPSHFDEGFEYPSGQRRKNRNAQKKSTVTGISHSSKLRGAPEPSRDLFVYRVEKSTEVNDIIEYLSSKKVTARNVTKVSNSEAKFDSFKVEVKVSDMHVLLDEHFWPKGICIRRFFKPRAQTSGIDSWD